MGKRIEVLDEKQNYEDPVNVQISQMWDNLNLQNRYQ